MSELDSPEDVRSCTRTLVAPVGGDGATTMHRSSVKQRVVETRPPNVTTMLPLALNRPEPVTVIC